MRIPIVSLRSLALPAILLSALLAACSQTRDAQADAEDSTADSVAAEIPITTSSEEARALFVEARRMFESLRGIDARPLLEQAVAIDSTFASAYLLLANTAPSPEEFFSNLERAVANMDHASDGERLQIEATKAGVDGRADEQMAMLRELCREVPRRRACAQRPRRTALLRPPGVRRGDRRVPAGGRDRPDLQPAL